VLTPDQAAWIRENIWPPIWLRSYEHIPGTFTDCACHKPRSPECRYGDHDRCTPAGDVRYESVIQSKALRPMTFAEPYAHRSPVISGTNVLAWVWLADRTCRSTCPGQEQAAVLPPKRQFELVELFDLAEVAA